METIQLKHTEIENSQHHGKEIIVIADGFFQMPSFGMFVRTAESFGAKKVIFISEKETKLTYKMKRRSCATENYIGVEFVKDGLQIIEQYKKQGYTILALERTNNSIPLHKYKSDHNKMVFIAGSERFGVSKEVLASCDHSLEIQMFGVNSSMNVIVASGIALNHLVHCKSST